MSCTSTKAEVPQLRYHSKHDDPSDDTVFISSDGTLFRASSFKLARASVVFQTMRETATPKFGEPIDFGASSKVAEAFFSLLLGERDPLLSLHIQDLLQLDEATHKWDCTKLQSLTKARLDTRLSFTPWLALEAACKADRVDIALEALRKSKNSSFEKIFWQRLNKLSGSWQAALLRALFEPDTKNPSKSSRARKRTSSITSSDTVVGLRFSADRSFQQVANRFLTILNETIDDASSESDTNSDDSSEEEEEIPKVSKKTKRDTRG